VAYLQRNESYDSGTPTFFKASRVGVVVGPGQSITYEKTAQTTTTVFVSGVAFINTP
jgi:hypothetical protein